MQETYTMNKVLRFIGLLGLFFIVPQIYANTLKEVFAIEEISSLYAICEKINKTPVPTDIARISSFLHHNDRDFYDCCQTLVICKKLSEDPSLKSTDETLCIKSIKCILSYLLLTKSCIYPLYKNELNETEGNFIENLKIEDLLKQINELEQKKSLKEESVDSTCTIF